MTIWEIELGRDEEVTMLFDFYNYQYNNSQNHLLWYNNTPRCIDSSIWKCIIIVVWWFVPLTRTLTMPATTVTWRCALWISRESFWPCGVLWRWIVKIIQRLRQTVPIHWEYCKTTSTLTRGLHCHHRKRNKKPPSCRGDNSHCTPTSLDLECGLPTPHTFTLWDSAKST